MTKTTDAARFFISCTVCDSQWVEMADSKAAAGADHFCPYFEGFEAQYGFRAETAAFLKVAPLKVAAGKRHVCNDDCLFALGATCRCACNGEHHGVGHLTAHGEVA